MGNSCQHQRTELITTISEDKGLFLSSKIVELKCLDCLTGGQPTVFRKEITQGRLTGHVYSQGNVDKKNCKHDHFEVDPATEKYQSRPTLSGTLLGMVTARFLESRDCYISGIGTCTRCQAKFNVECSYSRQTKWENYQQQTVETRKQWEIVKVRVPVHNTTKEEISYVN